MGTRQVGPLLDEILATCLNQTSFVFIIYAVALEIMEKLELLLFWAKIGKSHSSFSESDPN